MLTNIVYLAELQAGFLDQMAREAGAITSAAKGANDIWDSMFNSEPVEYLVTMIMPEAPDLEELKSEQQNLVKLLEFEYKKNRELAIEMNILENMRANDPFFGARKKRRIKDPSKIAAEPEKKVERPAIVILDSPELSNLDVKEYITYLRCQNALQAASQSLEASPTKRQVVENLEKVRSNLAAEVKVVNSLTKEALRIMSEVGDRTTDQSEAMVSALKVQIANAKNRLIDISLGRKPSQKVALGKLGTGRGQTPQDYSRKAPHRKSQSLESEADQEEPERDDLEGRSKNESEAKSYSEGESAEE